MAAANPKGLAGALKGKVGQQSKMVIASGNPNAIQVNATVKVSGTGPDGTVYLWEGTVGNGNVHQKGIRVQMRCVSGYPLTADDRKDATASGDLIDVDVTVTNPGTTGATITGVIDVE